MRNVIDMMAQGANLLKPTKPQTAFRYRYNDRPQIVAGGFEHKSVMNTVAFLMATEKKIDPLTGQKTKPITAEEAAKIMNQRGLAPQLFFKSKESLKIGMTFGTAFGGFKLLEGDENPVVVQRHEEFFTYAHTIAPFADVYLAPKFEIWTGEGPTTDPFLQLYQPYSHVFHVQPFGKDLPNNMHAKTAALLIATDNTVEMATYNFLMGLWGLIEEAISQVWHKDFLPSLSIQIMSNDSHMATTGDLDMVQRRFLAWFEYASRRLAQKHITFDPETMTGADQIFEQVWRGDIGRRLAKFIPTTAGTADLKRQFPLAARKVA